MWTKSVSIPIAKTVVTDENGFDTERYEFLTGVPASFTDLTRDDLLLANQRGYTADQTVEVMSCNYNGASFLVDEETGFVYDIQRSFKKDKGQTVQLTCRRRPDGKI